MAKPDKDRTTGPPRGSGRSTQDGRWWWDDSRQRWFRTIPDVEVLEIDVEDVGGTSLVSSLLTTLGTQHGVAYQRFVGRAHSADARWPAYSVVGGSFPVMRASLDDLQAHGAWFPRSRTDLASCDNALLPRAGGRLERERTGGPTATPALALLGTHDRMLTTASSGPATTPELSQNPRLAGPT